MSTHSYTGQRDKFFMKKYSTILSVLFLFTTESPRNFRLHSISHSFQQQWHCKPTHFLQGFCNTYFSTDIQQWVTFDLKWTKNTLLSKIVCAYVSEGQRLALSCVLPVCLLTLTCSKENNLHSNTVILTSQNRILV